VFTARYGLSPCIKETLSVSKGLKSQRNDSVNLIHSVISVDTHIFHINVIIVCWIELHAD